MNVTTWSCPVPEAHEVVAQLGGNDNEKRIAVLQVAESFAREKLIVHRPLQDGSAAREAPYWWVPIPDAEYLAILMRHRETDCPQRPRNGNEEDVYGTGENGAQQRL